MERYALQKIGTVQIIGEKMSLILEKQYIPAIAGLEEFGYINVLWWFSKCDSAKSRGKLIEASPYTGSPEFLGTFATRSPQRPNPIALTCAYITYIDSENGIVGLAYIDAEDGSPVLDIKPYTPSFDRVEKPIVPRWAQSWPKSVEKSGDFDWEKVFSF